MKIGGRKIIACLGMVMLFGQLAEAQWVKHSLPYKGSLEIIALAANGNNVFAATGYGDLGYTGSGYTGIFRSTDYGTTWNVANSGLTDKWVYSIAINSKYMFAGTGSGLFRSTDNGKSWMRDSAIIGMALLSFALNGSNGIYRIDHSVFRSEDSGKSRTDLNPEWPTDNEVWAISIIGRFIIAGTYYGITDSMDSGASWAEADSGLPSDTPTFSLAVAGGKIIASTYAGIYSSSDTGASWFADNNGLPEGVTGRVFAINGSTLFAGLDSSIYRSIDSGNTWSLVNSGGGGNALAVSGNLIMVGGNSGFWFSTNGATWTPSNTGLNINTVNSFAVEGKSVLTSATEGIFRSTDNGNSWTEVNVGGGSNLAFNGKNVLAVGKGL